VSHLAQPDDFCVLSREAGQRQVLEPGQFLHLRITDRNTIPQPGVLLLQPLNLRSNSSARCW
jgi:hypothetical protein